MKKYEAVFILDIRKVDEATEDFGKEFTALVETLGGKMESAVPMGRRQFSYDINKRKAGLYWNFVFELETAKVIEIKEKYKLNEKILRNLILIYDRPEKAVTALNME
ncbi:MAG: 30S ribosomal protein S6 [Victivallaceae bacterium]